VKRNRFVQLTGGSRSINHDLEAKARALAGLRGYITNLEAPTPEFVMGAYHQLWQIEKSFRMCPGLDAVGQNGGGRWPADLSAPVWRYP
jgi:hypothetical protein